MAKETGKKSIGVNVIWNGILSLTSILFPLITFPYITRVLGVETNGAISFSSSVVNYFALFASLGLSTYGVKACAQVKNNKKELSKVTHELLIISLTAAFVVLIFLFIMLFCIPQFSSYRSLMAVYSINIFLNVLGMNWMYQGIEKFRYITTRSIIFKIISIFMMFMFVKAPSDGVVYAGISVFASGAGNLLNAFYSHKYIDYSKFDNYELKKHLKPILTLFATILAINVYSHLDNVMLGFIHGDYATGIYYVAVKVKTILITLISSFSVVIMSRLSYINANESGSLNGLLKKSYAFIIMTTIPVATFFMLFAKESVIFLSGNEYVEATFAMQILLPTIVISSVSQIIGSQYSVSVGKERNLMIAVIFGAIANVVFNCLFIPKFSYNGAAVGTVIAEATQCTIQIILAKDMVKEVFSVKKFLQTVICAGTAAIVAYIVKHFLVINSVFGILLVNSIIFFAVFFALMLLIKYDMCIYMLDFFLSKVKKKKTNAN